MLPPLTRQLKCWRQDNPACGFIVRREQNRGKAQLNHTMKAYWQDLNDVVEPSDERMLTLTEALDQWADGRGVKGNYFGLIDSEDRTIQFLFVDSIPNHVDDARHLQIVKVDFPVPDRGGSYSKTVAIGEVSKWIEKAFKVGAHHEHYEGLKFSSW